MKKVHKSLIWTIIGLFIVASIPDVNAQDDLYYDPATDAPATAPATYQEENNGNNNVTQRYNDDDDEYYEDDEYAYQYSSRIRRFHRPSVVVDYYDPFYVDLYNYDPYYSPGTTIYVYNYNDYWSYRRWRRWQRWNSWNSYDYGWGAGWNSWGWQSSYAYNSPWYNPWVVNNYYYDPYWTCNGYNPYYQNYYNNGWVNHHYYYNNEGNGGGYAPKTYTGPRRGGSHVNPGYARIPDSKGRLATSQNNVPMLEKSTRVGRTATDIDPNAQVGRGKTATDRNVSPAPAGRKPEGSVAAPNGRNDAPENAKGRGEIQKPARNDEGYKPRRAEEATKPRRMETPSSDNDQGNKPRRMETATERPQRNEAPVRRNNNDGGTITPRRSEPAPIQREESRPARRSEERTIDRPTRSNRSDNGGGGSMQESRSSRSSGDGGSSSRSGSSNSSRSSSGSSNSGSSKSGKSGRN